MTIKNRNKKVEVGVIYRNLGDWNYKNNKKRICTKPIGVITIDGDEFVFSHNDILKILKVYLDVDERSIEMIRDKNIDTGEVNGIDIPFIEKIKMFVKKNSEQEQKFSEGKLF